MPDTPDLYALIDTFVSDTRAKIAAAKSDGKITLAEGFEIVTDAVSRLVNAASPLSIPGAEKKAAVLAAVDTLFDRLIAPIDIPWIPEPVESLAVDPLLKRVMHEFASGMVESFVKLLPKPSDKPAV